MGEALITRRSGGSSDPRAVTLMDNGKFHQTATFTVEDTNIRYVILIYKGSETQFHMVLDMNGNHMSYTYNGTDYFNKFTPSLSGNQLTISSSLYTTFSNFTVKVLY